MKSACFIPIKTNSERVKGKNFRILNGFKLYEYIIMHVLEADCFDDVYVDTNSEEIINYSREKGLNTIERKPELALNTANGNDLLIHHYELFPEYDFYFQCFATAPYLQPKSIRVCYEQLVNRTEYDSCFTALSCHSFFWMGEKNKSIPINYRPGILPRSQDLTPIYEETTGLYGITNSALKKYHCRIGSKPYIHIVSKYEAVDINTEEDLKLAEYIGKLYWKFENE